MPRPAHETLPSSHMPSVSQMNRLRTELMMFANRHDRLRIRRDARRDEKRFWISSMREYERPDVAEGLRFGYLLQYSLGGLALRGLSDESWSLRLFDVMEVTDLGSQVGGSRTIYRFDWDSDEVHLARRRTFPTPTREVGLDDQILGFYLPDDASWLPEMMLEFEALTEEDVRLLRKSIMERISPVDGGEREYKDRRLNYMDYFAK